MIFPSLVMVLELKRRTRALNPVVNNILSEEEHTLQDAAYRQGSFHKTASEVEHHKVNLKMYLKELLNSSVRETE